MVRNAATRLCLVLLVASSASPAFAQGGAGGRVEVAGFGGWSFGLPDVTEGLADVATELRLAGLRNLEVEEGSGFKWLVGGGVGVKVTDKLMVVGEYAVNRIASPSVTGTFAGQTFDASVDVNLSEFTGGVHYIFGGPDRRLEPYVGGAVGLARLSIKTRGSTSSSSEVFSSTEHQSDVAYNVGGGVRYRLSSSAGLRPELKIVHIPEETFGRISVAVFFQF